MALLSVKNLKLEKSGKRILDGLSFDLESGGIYALIGPNGAGKSTVAYVLMGLDGYREIKGDIVFEEKSIKRKNVSERGKLGITLAWQEPARFQGLKVADYLNSSAGNNGIGVEEALVRVGLDPKKYLNRAVDKDLSGGERKRIEFASIICMRPKLAILDEPDSGVDVEAMEKVASAIDYLKSIGTTILVITHNDRILKKADVAFLLCDGKLIDQSDGGNVTEYFRTKCLKCQHKNKPLEDKIKKYAGD